VVAPDQLHTLGQQALTMIASSQHWQAATQQAREQWIFNVGNSGSAGARILKALLDAPSPHSEEH
jgi:hypothetical protein